MCGCGCGSLLNQSYHLYGVNLEMKQEYSLQKIIILRKQRKTRQISRNPNLFAMQFDIS